MNQKFFKLSSIIISITIAATVTAGCGQKTDNSSTKATAAASSAAESKTVYPIKTDVTLKYWSPLNPNVSANYKNMGDTPFAKELEKKTGVKVQYLHPATGQEKDAFNILVASGDLPDVVEMPYYFLTGGPEAAIDSKVILKLNDSITKFAPNLNKYLKANAEVDKMVKTDSGSYYCFPFIRGDEKLMTYNGIAVRNDWITDLGLQSPTTIDEWYTVLKSLKEKKNVESPLSWNGFLNIFTQGAFVGAYGIKIDFFQDQGKIKYGPYEKEYKDFLTTMAKWYKEGLIDKNFASKDSKTFDADLVSGKIGASTMNVGGGLGKYIPALKEKDAKADLQPAAYPTLKKGDTARFGQKDLPFAKDNNGLSCITASSKNVEIAAKWLDYGYSDEGIMLNNFGIEGVSYNMVNNYPTMTDEVLKNPKKLPVGQAWSQYARSVADGAFIQRKEYTEQYNTLPAQQEALKIWPKTDASKYLLPTLTPTSEESTQYSKIMNEVNTYVNEYSMKYIMGVEAADSYDKFNSQLKSMGIEKAIAIQQAALERYNKR